MSQILSQAPPVASDKDFALHGANRDYADETPRPRLWTTDEYYRAAELGIFKPEEKLELIRGEILHMSPQLKPHANGIMRADFLFMTFVDGKIRCVRVQLPITLSNNTEPEPDVAVVSGGLDDYETKHPSASDVLLLLEVSDKTLSYDRNRKAQIYAEDGIADYWLLNLRARQLEVRRDPQNGVYQNQKTYNETESIAPLFAPQTPVLVSDLLPRNLVPQG